MQCLRPWSEPQAHTVLSGLQWQQLACWYVQCFGNPYEQFEVGKLCSPFNSTHPTHGDANSFREFFLGDILDPPHISKMLPDPYCIWLPCCFHRGIISIIRYHARPLSMP